ncbi:MAG: glutamate--cysteine ligase, partial [Methylocystaceae bacterium]
MARDVNDTTPITSRNALVEWLEAGIKPPSDLNVGTEHEKIPFFLSTHAPVPYDVEGGGVKALLEGLGAALDWAPILDEDRLIGLYDEHGQGAVSLEPGGQFELSGAPLPSVHATQAEIVRHFEALEPVARRLGIGFLDLGASPRWRREETPVMPKQRYGIMAAYMPKVGSLGLDMMFRTATIQVNLDFVGEADMVDKLRVGLALQPIVTALFANSPFLDGRPTGLLSQRSQIWRDTDAARTGMLPFAFEPGMGFERYVDYALDVPLYFVKRGDVYHDVSGASFRDLLDGKLSRLPGERAIMSDWTNHLGTIFPEARLKRYLEMRGADAGPRS